MKKQMRSFDATDTQIAHELGLNGQHSNREVAKRLGISEGCVRYRLKRMIESGRLRVKAQVNIECLQDSFLALVGFKIDGRKLTQCAQRIRALTAVVTTMIVAGRYDLVAIVLAPSHRTLVDFVTNDLSVIHGIRDSETIVVLRSYDQWIDASRAFQWARTELDRNQKEDAT